VIVSNKKKVVSVAFRNHYNTKTEFYLDIAIYIEQDGYLYHIKRNDNGKYIGEYGTPRKTYERQKEALSYMPNKRNAIIILKYLKEKNRIEGVSSIFITDMIISYSNNLDTFSLIKKFIEENIFTNTFKLVEAPKSELINDVHKFHQSLDAMSKKFFTEISTNEVYNSMNS